MMQGGMPSAARMQQQQEKAEKAKEMRDELLKKVLSPEARSSASTGLRSSSRTRRSGWRI